MKEHTSEFKKEIKTLGKQQTVRITYTTDGEIKTLNNEDINSATPNYEASLLKSVMKVLDLDSNIDIPLNTEIKFEYGLLVNGAYEYLNYGNYIVYSSEKQEDTLSYKIKCYDKLLYSMKDYEHIDITYPCTIKQYLVALCNKIGLEFKDSDFANSNRQITSELFMTLNEDGSYSSMGYTYRDVLDQIAETTGGCICMTLDDKVEVRYINELYNKKSATGNPIHITDSTKGKLEINKINGGHKQEIGRSKNLFNIKDVRNFSAGVTVSEDDWITITGDNSSGTRVKYLNFYTNNLDLKPNTDYAVILEIKQVAGTGFLSIPSLAPTSGSVNQSQFSSDWYSEFTDITSNKYKRIRKTISDLSLATCGVRGYVAYAPGKAGTIILRVSVLEDTSVDLDTFVYEKYKVFPSPNYPSQIETVDGNVGIDIVNSNLFNIKETGLVSKTAVGVTITLNSDNSITVNGTATDNYNFAFNSNTHYLEFYEGKTYTIVQQHIDGIATGYLVTHFLFYNEQGKRTWGWLSSNALNASKVGQNTATERGYSNSFIVYVNKGATYTNYKIKLMVLEGNYTLDTIPPYADCQTQTITMPIQQEMLEGDYIADVEHHEWGKIESYNGETITTDYISTTGELTTGATVYYKLATPIDLELTEEQKTARNQKLYTYENITNINTSNDLVKLDITYATSKETIDEEYINDTNVNFGEKYGVINSVVLARAGESDRVYKKDQASIDENGLCELLISENQFMNFNDRSDYLSELTEKLFGIEYYLNDFVSTGIMYYDLLDMYNVEIYGKTYNCLMLNDEQLITQGLEENIHTDRPETSETDYTKANKTDRKINQTNLIVDKQNQKIEGVISQIGDRSHKTTTITADIEGLNSKVENVADFTREKTQTENMFLDDIAEGEGYMLNFKIYGNTNFFTSKKITICASKNVRGYGTDINLLTEDSQELLTEDGQEIIIGEGSSYIKSLEITLDDYLRNLKEGNNEYFDTLEIAQDGTITITRNIKVDDDGTLYLLNEPVVTVLDEKLVLPSLKEGTYYFIEELAGLRYYANYIIQNDYSDTFMTKLELGTQITQNAESVKIAWNQISDFIQMMIFNNNVSLCIVDENNNVIASFDKEGEHFYKNGETMPFGEMGVQTVDDKQYISFAVKGEYEQDIENGMSWGIKTKSDGKFFPIFYIKDFTMGAEGSDAWSGSLVLTACDIVLDGTGTGIQSGSIRIYGDPGMNTMYFMDTTNNKVLMEIHANEPYLDSNNKLQYKNIIDILEGNLTVSEYADTKEISIFDKMNFFKNQAGSNSFKIGDDNKYCLLADDGFISCTDGVFCNGNIGADGDIVAKGNVYASNILSDKRIKDNIKDSTANALGIIKQIKHKQFDKKDDGKHYDIGYIAQEMEKIDPNFVLIRPKTEQLEERYYINELPIIATVSKAIQEQQEQIENLKQIINKQQEQINKILGGE